MAVREVNLIPADILHARRVKRRFRMWGALMIVLPSLIWGGYGATAVRILAQRQAPHDLTELRRDYGLTIAEISRLEQELNVARPVQDLFFTRDYSDILSALSDLVPEDVQVATCSIHPVAGEWRLVLTGKSQSNTVLGDFVKQMEEHATFAEVAMTLSRASQAPGVPSDATEKPASGYRIECVVPAPGESA